MNILLIVVAGYGLTSFYTLEIQMSSMDACARAAASFLAPSTIAVCVDKTTGEVQKFWKIEERKK